MLCLLFSLCRGRHGEPISKIGQPSGFRLCVVNLAVYAGFARLFNCRRPQACIKSPSLFKEGVTGGFILDGAALLLLSPLPERGLLRVVLGICNLRDDNAKFVRSTEENYSKLEQKWPAGPDTCGHRFLPTASFSSYFLCYACWHMRG